ncbi:copper oxidase [Caryophanon latum]|uniref:Copper oxidase n=2 Tax=Caryophanon latum TaxID=33977 RepID=A0A1C0YPQ7_9BACL|nr:copper oxidase [Caryophanon latum]
MMRKLLCILSASAALLAACNNEQVKEEEQVHAHHGTRYANEQLTLQHNEGIAALTFPPVLQPVSRNGQHVTYALTAQKGEMTFVDGITTDTYGYNGNFLGPVLHLTKGEHVTIQLTNALDEPTTFHWHGLEVAGDATDGGPHAVIEPGVTETIDFVVKQQAATLWYHPHPMGQTAKQVYNGLAGLLYIEDDVVRDIPSDYAVNDFPIVLQDRTFVDGNIVYEDVANTSSTLGDTMMINGVVEPFLTTRNEPVRLRLLNGSNALTYYLSFSNDMPFQLLATDGGFLNEPQEMTKLTLGAGERAEILVDLTNVADVALMHDDIVVLPIETTGEAVQANYSNTLNEIALPVDVTTMEPTKHITMEGMTTNFLLNGQTYDETRIDLRQQRGVTEVWEIENIINEEGAMAHPFHIHGTQFHVISVNGEAPDASLQGLKDTVTVQPGQKVRIAVTFHEVGLYMYHCHILEHEDVGMMGQIEVYE